MTRYILTAGRDGLSQTTLISAIILMALSLSAHLMSVALPLKDDAALYLFLTAGIMTALVPAMIVAIRQPRPSQPPITYKGLHYSDAMVAWALFAVLNVGYFALLTKGVVSGVWQWQAGEEITLKGTLPMLGVVPVSIALIALMRYGPFQHWTVSRTVSVALFSTVLFVGMHTHITGHAFPRHAIIALLFAIAWGTWRSRQMRHRMARGETVIGVLLGLFFSAFIVTGLPALIVTT